MSKIALTPNASGTGTFTIAAPNSNTNRTLTLPDVSGEVFSQGNILGTVSESAGVPTGAIIERGSNANGEYVKFADGTAYLSRSGIAVSASTSSGNIFIGVGTTWNFPISLADGFIGGGGINSTFRWVSVSSIGSTSATVQLFSTVSTGNVNTAAWLIGRWF
jgi:hypothetical protein